MSAKDMKFAVLDYAGGDNIGDDIQSIAAARLLPAVDCRIHRDQLHRFGAPERHLLVMNGWFCHYPERWPPAPAVLPLFFAFHVTNRIPVWPHFSEPSMLAYFRNRQPIGCRDRDTAARFSALGVDSYYSKCLTLTLPTREASARSRDGKVFVVDAGDIPIPPELARDAIQVTHVAPTYIDGATRWSVARQLLDLYRDQARLVITTRLHCALPCVAMGIPVVYFGDPHDHRIAVAADIGLPIHSYPLPAERALVKVGHRLRRRFGSVPRAEPEYLYRPPQNPFAKSAVEFLRGVGGIGMKFRRDIDWNPAPIDIENYKGEIIGRFTQALQEALAN